MCQKLIAPLPGDRHSLDYLLQVLILLKACHTLCSKCLLHFQSPAISCSYWGDDCHRPRAIVHPYWAPSRLTALQHHLTSKTNIWLSLNFHSANVLPWFNPDIWYIRIPIIPLCHPKTRSSSPFVPDFYYFLLGSIKSPPTAMWNGHSWHETNCFVTVQQRACPFSFPCSIKRQQIDIQHRC
jgi:hypothetical protein